jgi:SAM-dependent methyltransferase
LPLGPASSFQANKKVLSFQKNRNIEPSSIIRIRSFEVNMPVRQFNAPPFNAHYEGAYSEGEMTWRRLGAIDKANNLQSLLGSRSIYSVLEAGCGTGAVLAEIAKKGIGMSHTGVDIEPPSTHLDPDASKLTFLEYNGTTLPFPDNNFDLVFASHVVEHVLDPRGFISELSRVARRFVYLEVPCELHFRTTHKALQTSLDIGHINAYSLESFAILCSTSGLRVIDIRLFDHSFAIHSTNTSTLAAVTKMAIRRSLLQINSTLASRFFTYHCGVLCVPEDKAAVF